MGPGGHENAAGLFHGQHGQALEGRGVVNLHPVAIILAILFFGGLWGFWGIFFAIPLATFVKAVLNAWPRKKEDAEQPEETQLPQETA